MDLNKMQLQLISPALFTFFKLLLENFELHTLLAFMALSIFLLDSSASEP